MQHELKTWPEYFQAILDGNKTAEIRKNDRGFMVGDTLILKEFVPCQDCHGCGRIKDHTDMADCGCAAPHGKYTGRDVSVLVTNIFDGRWGMKEGYVAMSFKPVPRKSSESCIDVEKRYKTVSTCATTACDGNQNKRCTRGISPRCSSWMPLTLPSSDP
jgi:hypothetical protein